MTDKLPAEVKSALTDPALAAQPEDLVGACYAGFTTAQKDRFRVVVETLRADYQGRLSEIQIAMAAVAVVVFDMTLAEFMTFMENGQVNRDDMARAELFEFARKFYNESFNGVLKTVDRDAGDTNFLRDLDEFQMNRAADGSMTFTGKKSGPKLSTKTIKVVDTTVVQNPSPNAASPPQSGQVAIPRSDDDVII